MDTQHVKAPGRQAAQLIGTNTILPGLNFRFKKSGGVYTNSTNGAVRNGEPVRSGIRRVGTKPLSKKARRWLKKQSAKQQQQL